MSKYGVFSGPYFPVFGPERTLYLDTFHAVLNYFDLASYGSESKKQYTLKVLSVCLKEGVVLEAEGAVFQRCS